MALIDDLQRLARENAALIDQIDAGFARELVRVLRDLNRRTRQIVLSLEQSNGRLVASQAALGRALRLRAEIQVALTEAGYTALVDAALDEPLDRLAIQVLRGRSVTARAARLTPVDLSVLEAWKTIRQADLLDVGDDIVTAVWRSTMDGVLGARQTGPLIDEIAVLTEASERRAQTVYDTAASTYSRQVDQLGIDAASGDRFVYVGPVDDRTRPFCRDLVGEVRTRAELDTLDNGQLPNTLLTGGGWNCRHKWLYLADLEVEDLAA